MRGSLAYIKCSAVTFLNQVAFCLLIKDEIAISTSSFAKETGLHHISYYINIRTCVLSRNVRSIKCEFLGVPDGYN